LDSAHFYLKKDDMYVKDELIPNSSPIKKFTLIQKLDNTGDMYFLIDHTIYLTHITLMMVMWGLKGLID